MCVQRDLLFIMNIYEAEHVTRQCFCTFLFGLFCLVVRRRSVQMVFNDNVAICFLLLKFKPKSYLVLCVYMSTCWLFRINMIYRRYLYLMKKIDHCVCISVMQSEEGRFLSVYVFTLYLFVMLLLRSKVFVCEWVVGHQCKCEWQYSK